MSEFAVFLDRDGTLVHPYHYPTRPAHLRLYDGVAEELRLLQRASWKLIVVTNQSGMAHGLFDERALYDMHARLATDLAGAGVIIDEFYCCPHHPAGTVPELACDCDCRKPRPGLLLRAASDFGLDLSRCWFVGDILDDVEAGRAAGCRTVLVDLGTESPSDNSRRRPDFVGRDTVHALRIVQCVEGLRSSIELGYRPDGWQPMPSSVAARPTGHGASR